ncbi:hypothetical protein BS47DRAFT_1384328 [Hydnum rufescens UP504]|uniref:Uncharacterized protein n=1 Tax=Hydnum rufescens UP504 TaxID=1448309 RepID=A0A9P6DQ32_9AGAM|nr:hypothetical protein BS47DRAFT_1384328 [Hydnum rufescens UP504]
MFPNTYAAEARWGSMPDVAGPATHGRISDGHWDNMKEIIISGVSLSLEAEAGNPESSYFVQILSSQDHYARPFPLLTGTGLRLVSRWRPEIPVGIPQCDWRGLGSAHVPNELAFIEHPARCSTASWGMRIGLQRKSRMARFDIDVVFVSQNLFRAHPNDQRNAETLASMSPDASLRLRHRRGCPVMQQADEEKNKGKATDEQTTHYKAVLVTSGAWIKS